MNKTLAIGISPNVQKDDVLLSLKLFFSPWKNLGNEGVSNLERWFRNYFGISYAISFMSGRGALYAILHEMNIGKGDEVIIQAFTCAVVADAILATGAKVVYADITNSLTLDPKEVEKKITSHTKAILIQHTFGIPGPMEKLLAIAQKNNLFVIEDVAHTIGAKYKKKKLGTFGDAAIFSFGRDKAFSSVWGGMAITNNKVIGQRLRAYQKTKSKPSLRFSYQQLLHPIITSVALPVYDFFSLGKVILVVSQRLGFLSSPVSRAEKEGKFSLRSVRKLPNILALLALNQLKKIEEYNDKREELVSVYQKLLPENIQCASSQGPFLRFPIVVKEPTKVLQTLRKKLHVYGGTWYSNNIDPKGSNMLALGYKAHDCPRAEEIASHMVNLPLLPNMEKSDAEKIAKIVNTLL